MQNFYIDNEEVDVKTLTCRIENELIIFLRKVLNRDVQNTDSIYYLMSKTTYEVILELGYTFINDVYFGLVRPRNSTEI